MDEANKQMGNGKQGEFDMAFWDDDGNLVIVEAKGGNSQLGSRQLKYATDETGERIQGRAQQGTQEYMDDIIANYEAKLGKDHPFVEELLEAKKDGEIKYVSVRQPLKKDGSLKNDYVVNEFKL
ncbi:hypothetical protein GCM10011297_34110 [Bacterioplanes sanyensis]|uniref:hypothetical protein n=1 Tax=Bacterioplanes sanyensis TaxID=1249553 RepID=UPI001672D7A3|nr:hypothetical protein [Bacterioplanes sanyensis]GGY58626.1 hypothetical protein GCM10011297_34110 [Bacterioplanes sanyensis]